MAVPEASNPPEPQRLDPAETQRRLHWQANAMPPEPPSRSEIEAALRAALPEEVTLEVMRLVRPPSGFGRNGWIRH
jgi:hypothetical protein